jgi:hypothetical protein
VVATAATGDAPADEGLAASQGTTDPEPEPEAEVLEPGQAVVADAEPAKHIVEIRSTPAGTLYADGLEAPLCTATPCKIEVSVSEEPGAFAVYIIKREGYVDHEFKVSLTDPPEMVERNLEGAGESQDAGAADAGSDVGAATTDGSGTDKAGKQTAKTVSKSAKVGKTRSGKARSGRAKARNTGKAGKSGKTKPGKTKPGRDKYGRPIPGYDPFAN